ncbi:SNF2 family N-terminal domain-containing protein 1 [Elsinoe fawcettii]|nr:SNF2 family N-terminal domain-containing protein 1 [Elsinoe fawcettii]
MNPAQLLNPKAFAKSAAKKSKGANSPHSLTTNGSNSKTSGRPATPPPAQNGASGTSTNNPTTPSRGKTSNDTTMSSSPLTPSKYNPAQLLNPKSAQMRNANDPQYKDIQAPQEDEAGAPSNTYGSILERFHNVEKREAAPLKRRAVANEDDEQDRDKKKAKFTGGGKGGIIGESVREMRQKAQEAAGPGAIVDLTEKDDDDELKIMDIKPTESKDDPRREVCIGQIAAHINAHRIPHVNGKALSSNTMWGPSKIFYQRAAGQLRTIEIRDRQTQHFGNLDFRVAEVLVPLISAPLATKFRMTMWLPPRVKKDPFSKPGHATSELMSCHITIFCSRLAVEQIGLLLSKKGFWLQDPTSNREMKEVVNPHKPKDYGPKRTATTAPALSGGSGSGTFISRTAEEVASDVKNIIDHLPNSEGLPMIDTDMNFVRTPIMDHQKQALYWMSIMESPYDPSDPNKVGLWKQDYKQEGWYNSISGHEVKKLPDCLGGLFADDMGLGKTLSILARVATTLGESREFGKSTLSKVLKKQGLDRNNGATLVVCPTGVLSNWDEQIKAHLDTSKVKYYKYHGSNRVQDVNELAKYDVVITSYGTVAGEMNRSNNKFSALAKLNWFRVVLDEAHSIKNMQTGWFKGCCLISSPRRWAVTGTPVQNRLDDLGALVKFIKLAPFHEKGAWEQFFLSTFKSGNELALPNLKALVGSVMLRRSKKRLNMVDIDRQTVHLDFSSSERSLYEAFMRDSGIKVDTILRDNRLRGKGTAHMLTFITRLRLICCHGRELLSDEDMKVLEGRTMEDAIDLGDEDEMDKPVLTDHQVYSTLRMMRETNVSACEGCGNEIGREDVIQAADEDESDEEESEAEETDNEDNDNVANGTGSQKNGVGSGNSQKDRASTAGDSTAESTEHHDIVLGYMTPDYHLFCPKCIDNFKVACARTLTSDNHCDCPVDGNYIRAVFAPITRQGIEAEEERRRELVNNIKKGKDAKNYGGPHTKVKALISRLQENIAESQLLPEGTPPIRSVVFSGWTQYLDLIGIALDNAGIPSLRLDGSMHATKRAKVITQFREDSRYTVMLVSIRAGGQGLNFTAANKVYMMEPQFNPGVENQAIDRVHRIGQTRPVEIVKFIMRDSFEGRIIKLQEQKMMLAKEAFGEGGKGGIKERMEGLRSLFK